MRLKNYTLLRFLKILINFLILLTTYKPKDIYPSQIFFFNCISYEIRQRSESQLDSCSAINSCCLTSDAQATMQILLTHKSYYFLTLKDGIEGSVQPCYSLSNCSVDKQAIKEHLQICKRSKRQKKPNCMLEYIDLDSKHNCLDSCWIWECAI